MECPRETRERAEELLVCSRGVLAKESTGRPRPEPECEVRCLFLMMVLINVGLMS